MRISDWSSDVCSSDLPGNRLRAGNTTRNHRVVQPDVLAVIIAHIDVVVMRLHRVAGEGAARGRAHRREPGRCRRQEHRWRGIEQQIEVDERSEEHTSELQSLMRISYAVFCLKKKNDTRSSQHLYVNDSSKRCTTHIYWCTHIMQYTLSAII